MQKADADWTAEHDQGRTGEQHSSGHVQWMTETIRQDRLDACPQIGAARAKNR
jgi:hypothetical protein